MQLTATALLGSFLRRRFRKGQPTSTTNNALQSSRFLLRSRDTALSLSALLAVVFVREAVPDPYDQEKEEVEYAQEEEPRGHNWNRWI